MKKKLYLALSLLSICALVHAGQPTKDCDKKVSVDKVTIKEKIDTKKDDSTERKPPKLLFSTNTTKTLNCSGGKKDAASQAKSILNL